MAECKNKLLAQSKTNMSVCNLGGETYCSSIMAQIVWHDVLLSKLIQHAWERWV